MRENEFHRYGMMEKAGMFFPDQGLKQMFPLAKRAFIWYSIQQKKHEQRGMDIHGTL